MAKDPAFLFYTNDFLSGTQFFSDEQLGKFLRLLMAQHQHGSLTRPQVINICKSYDEDVMSKFKLDDNGRYYNERLKIEVDKRRAYSESRKKNKEGTGKSHVPHMSEHMENRNKDINNIKEDKQIEVLATPEVIEGLKVRQYKDKEGIMRTYGLTETEYNQAVDIFCLEDENTQKDFIEVVRHFKKWVGTKLSMIKEVSQGKVTPLQENNAHSIIVKGLSDESDKHW